MGLARLLLFLVTQINEISFLSWPDNTLVLTLCYLILKTNYFETFRPTVSLFGRLFMSLVSRTLFLRDRCVTHLLLSKQVSRTLSLPDRFVTHSLLSRHEWHGPSEKQATRLFALDKNKCSITVHLDVLPTPYIRMGRINFWHCCKGHHQEKLSNFKVQKMLQGGDYYKIVYRSHGVRQRQTADLHFC